MSAADGQRISVRIREVGPRDGLQTEPRRLSTRDKVQWIEQLAATGLTRIELTSLVRPDVIPQLADAEEVLRAVQLPASVERTVIVPSRRGLERALAVKDRIDQVGIFMSASDGHSTRNIRRGVEESLRVAESLLPQIRASGLRAASAIAVAFGCPYDGVVPLSRVIAIATRMRDAGAQEILFGDTTGMANPRQVKRFFQAMRSALDNVELTAHFHNTRGQGLANVVSALEAGITSFESSVGELGGCIFPPGATGNIATEDLVSMLNEMDYDTGIELRAVLAAARATEAVVGRPLTSHTISAGPIEWASPRHPEVPGD